jgi:hypothetical protein
MLIDLLNIFGLVDSVVCRHAQRVFCYLLRREVYGVKWRRTDLVMIGTGLFLRVAAGHSACIALACNGTPPEFSLLLFNLFRTSSRSLGNQTKSTILGLNVGRGILTNRPRNQSLGSGNTVLCFKSWVTCIFTMLVDWNLSETY